jgi:hypothetical protein
MDAADFAEWRSFDRISPLDTTLRLEVALATVALLAERAKGNDANDYRIDWPKSLRREKTLEDATEREGLSDSALASLSALEALGGM